MACFANINVSQGSVATYARCRGIFNTHLTANLPMNLPVKNFVNRLRFDSLWPRFLAHPVYLYHISLLGYCRLCTKATWPNTPLLDMHRPLLAVITQSLYSARSTYHPFQRYDGGPNILKWVTRSWLRPFVSRYRRYLVLSEEILRFFAPMGEALHRWGWNLAWRSPLSKFHPYPWVQKRKKFQILKPNFGI